MDYSEAKLIADIERIKQIPVVSSMLEVICQSTGMGFAAIARVTKDRWIAGRVRDEISFGLKEGGELPIESTICNEIQGSHEAVIIDNVDEDVLFCNHKTPAIYGFKSYISVPIFLKNGEFFGTLCAIDPKPAALKESKVYDMFALFAELISFHLQSIQIVEQSRQVVSNLNTQLSDSVNMNRQYSFISNHNLQEPLRKMRVFGGMLVDAAEKCDMENVRKYAEKVDICAQKFSAVVNELSEFSELYTDTTFDPVHLNEVVAQVAAELLADLEAANANVEIMPLPVVIANKSQMEQLFRNLISNSIRNGKPDSMHSIRFSSDAPLLAKKGNDDFEDQKQFARIQMEDNGSGFSKFHLEKIFDIFSQFPGYQEGQTNGSSLAFCRKIVSNHGGTITAESEHDQGTIFSIILPGKPIPAEN